MKFWSKTSKRHALIGLAVGLGFMLWTYLALFRFDWRALAGFELRYEADPKDICMMNDESLLKDQLTSIYLSKKGKSLEASSSRDLKQWSIILTGPAIFRFKSGRMVITNGAYIDSKASRVTIYAQ